MRFSFGSFYGELQKRAEVAGIGLTEPVYPARLRLPLHAHESLYFCLVLKGDYEEIGPYPSGEFAIVEVPGAQALAAGSTGASVTSFIISAPHSKSGPRAAKGRSRA